MHTVECKLVGKLISLWFLKRRFKYLIKILVSGLPSPNLDDFILYHRTRRLNMQNKFSYCAKLLQVTVKEIPVFG